MEIVPEVCEGVGRVIAGSGCVRSREWEGVIVIGSKVYEIGVSGCVGSKVGVGAPVGVRGWFCPEFRGGWRKVVSEKPVSCSAIKIGNRNKVVK